MSSPLVHYLERTVILRVRSLPGLAHVLVRKGQLVQARDAIAQDVIRPNHLLLEISRGLGVPAEQADRLIQCKTGALLAPGDLIAGPVGLTRRVVRAPRSGRVVMVGGGLVLLELTSDVQVILAGFPGEIHELLPDRGAVVKTTGALVQAVWGNGKTGQGILQDLRHEPLRDLVRPMLQGIQAEAVVMAGHCQDREVFQVEKTSPISGLILASLDPAVMSAAQAAPFPVLVIEGFGNHAINPVASEILSAASGCEIALNAEAWDRLRGLRPEAVIPLPAEGGEVTPPESELFAPGQRVRIVRAPYLGQHGTLVDLCGAARMPSGILAEAAEIRFADGKSATLPLANLEIVE